MEYGEKRNAEYEMLLHLFYTRTGHCGVYPVWISESINLSLVRKGDSSQNVIVP